MPATVLSISSGRAISSTGVWSLLEVALPGQARVPFAIVLVEEKTDAAVVRVRDRDCFEDLEEDQRDWLDALGDDLVAKGREAGGRQLLDGLEDSLSHFLRITDRAPVAWSGSSEAAADRLFEDYVDSRIQPFISHLPFYALRAAATRFGEMSSDSGDAGAADHWVRVPASLRLTEGMFVAQVVGRSMEPRIPDGSLCIFRAPVVGSRRGRLLLIEKRDETDFAWRYTVKKYARQGTLPQSEDGDTEFRSAPIRLEPLNPEFEAFELAADDFRVVAEFVQVLDA